MVLRVWKSFKWRSGKAVDAFCFIAVCALIFVSPTQGKAENEFHVSNDFVYTYNDVSGPGGDQSSLTEGFRYLNNLNVTGMGKTEKLDYHIHVGAMFTDDSRSDPQTFSLTNFQGRLSNRIHTLDLGDTFQSFSQYSLATSLKGGSYRFFDETSGLPEVTLIYGFANPRWDNFWGFGQHRIDVVKREVWGGRVKHAFSEQFQAGFSVVQSNDSDRVMVSDELLDISSYTLDWEYGPIPGLTIRGESSLSETSESPQAGLESKYQGNAHRISAVGDGGPSRVKIEYERVSPDFKTVMGAATSDREKAKIKWRYRYNRRRTLTTSFLWYRDNLYGTKQYRTDHYRPQVIWTLKRPFGRKYGVTDLAYYLDIKQKDTETTALMDHRFNWNHRDRFGFLDVDFNLGYTLNDNKEDPREKNHEYTYNTSLNSRHTLGAVVVKPTLRLGGWNRREELEDDEDRIYEYSLGCGLDIPAMNVTSHIVCGQNSLAKSQGDDSDKFFGRFNVFYRPAFLKKLNYAVLYLKAYINDFNFDTASREFRETSITTGLNIQF